MSTLIDCLDELRFSTHCVNSERSLRPRLTITNTQIPVSDIGFLQNSHFEHNLSSEEI